MYANDSCHFMAAKSWFTERPLLPVSCTEDKHLVAIFKQVAKTRNDVTAFLYHLSPFQIHLQCTALSLMAQGKQIQSPCPHLSTLV